MLHNICIQYYPNKRDDQSHRIEEISGDIQYILETLTGLEERVSKIESSGNQGNGRFLGLGCSISSPLFSLPNL